MNKGDDYIVTIREKYKRLEKTFRVNAITFGKTKVADINETKESYTINNGVFLKKDLMFFRCVKAN